MKTCQMVSMAVQMEKKKASYGDGCDYIFQALRWVESYLKYTPHHVMIYTNKPEAFDHIKDERFKAVFMGEDQMHPDSRCFDESLKFKCIKGAMEEGKDVVYWMDADMFTMGWDEESFQMMVCSEVNDVWIEGELNIDCLHYYRPDKRYTPPNDHPCYQFGWKAGLCEKSYSHKECRAVYTNMDKLKEMVALWDDTSFWKEEVFKVDNEKWRGFNGFCGRPGTIGVMFGMAIHETGAKWGTVKSKVFAFASHERVFEWRGARVLGRDWHEAGMKSDEEKLIEKVWHERRCSKGQPKVENKEHLHFRRSSKPVVRTPKVKITSKL